MPALEFPCGLCYNALMLKPSAKKKLIEAYRVHEKDTGSSEVQVAVLSEEIKQLTEHLKQHRKDNHSRRGLLKKVADRRRLLTYLAKADAGRCEQITKKLGLKDYVSKPKA